MLSRKKSRYSNINTDHRARAERDAKDHVADPWL